MKDFHQDPPKRATFHQIKPRRNIRPTKRELRWLKHIERHGPQSSELLFELTRDTHCCKDTALRDLQKLRAGGLLTLPPQQRVTERAEFNPYVYDLTKQAKDHLSGIGLSEESVRPTGHWWHGYSVSAFTGSLDIHSKRASHEYIPAHIILGRNDAELAVPVGRKRLIPDQLFAIRYEEGFRAFLLEVDRGTEPKQSSAARKSLRRSVDQYAEMFRRDIHRRHYGLRANTVSLWAFANTGSRVRFHEMVEGRAGDMRAYFLSKLLPERLSWVDLVALHQAPWRTGDGREVEL